MLNSNQIAEAVAILGLSCASVAAPLSALLDQMSHEQDAGLEPVAEFSITAADLYPATTSGVSSWEGLHSLQMDAELRGVMVTTEEYGHPLTWEHPEHSEWCAASQILKQIESQGEPPPGPPTEGAAPQAQEVDAGLERAPRR